MHSVDNSTGWEGGNSTESQSVDLVLGTCGAVSLATVSVAANVVLVVKLQVDSRHSRTSSNVSLVLTMLAILGLVNGFTLGLLQICSFAFDRESVFTDKFCKIQGLASSLMSLLILWFQALLSFERHMKYVNPQEHSMTFSKLNMQVVAIGLFFMLLSAVAGPVYGWGKYAFIQELCACGLDVRANNAVSYFAMATVTYIGTPYAVITYSYAGLAAHCLCPPKLSHTAASMSSSHSDSRRKSDSLAAPGPLAVAAFLSLATQAPVVTIGLMLVADADYKPRADATFLLFWLYNVGACCGIAVCCLVYDACANGHMCPVAVPGHSCLRAAFSRIARRFLVPYATTVSVEMSCVGTTGPSTSCSVTVTSTFSDNNLCKL